MYLYRAKVRPTPTSAVGEVFVLVSEGLTEVHPDYVGGPAYRYLTDAGRDYIVHLGLHVTTGEVLAPENMAQGSCKRGTKRVLQAASEALL